MATITIVATQNTDNSITIKSTDAPSWVAYVPNEKMQIKRLLFALKDLIETNFTIS